MKFKTGVNRKTFLNDVTKETTGYDTYAELLKADPKTAEELKAEAEANTEEWERILYFA